MTVQALLKEIRQLRSDELQLVAAELGRLVGENSPDNSISSPTTDKASKVQWADRTARRQEIFGENQSPNLVLEEREQARW